MNFANNNVAAEWRQMRLSTRFFQLLFARQNRGPFDQPCRPIRYQNPSASRQALKAAIREDGRPNPLELASDPAAISSGALGIGTPACWSRIQVKEVRCRASVQIERHESSDDLVSVFDQDTCAIRLAVHQKFTDHMSYPRAPV